MLWVIVKKELKRVFTDRRLVFSAFLLPAISIYVLYSLMGNMIGNMSQDLQEHVPQVVIINSSDSFKDFSVYLEDELDIEFVDQSPESIGDIKTSTYGEAVKAGDKDVILVFPDGFDEDVIAYETVKQPNVDTFYNPGEEYSQNAINRVEYMVGTAYQNYLLTDRFGDAAFLEAFTINVGNESNTIAEEGKEAGLGMSFMLPMLLNIMLFAGAMGIGIDVIAGEKERGTMATLLLTPVDREKIALGKVLSLGIVAVISAMCSFGAIIASLPNASTFLAAGADVSFDSFGFAISDYLMLLSLIIVQVGIFVGLICLISVIAKSVKEAGTYISPIYMLVMISAFATIFSSGEVEMYNFAIPVMGNVFAIKELMTFDLSMAEYGVTAGVSIVVILVLLKLITMAFNNERTMFNT